MKTPRWRQIETLFHAALEHESSERPAFLAEACRGDEELQREVDSLLASYQPGGSVLNVVKDAAADRAGNGVQEEEDRTIGRTLNHFQILSKLGKGGMGEVYLARDTRLRRRVALKVLAADLVADAEWERRFLQEAQAASLLNHSNIVTVYEIGEAENVRYIATEYVEGETLRQRLQRGDMTFSESVEIGIQVGSALQAAHAAGLVHRDIKPENLMLRPDGHIKVLDFGIVKLLETETARTAATMEDCVKTGTGLLMGTAHYMSPEQVRGLEVDARTDIWSLGVVLYEMLAGRRPFDGETLHHLVVAVLERAPAALARRRGDVPAELERTVMRALAKDREERYQRVEDLTADLRRLSRVLDHGTALHRSEQRGLGAALLDAVPNNLPQALTTFVGRTEQIVEVHRLLGTARLVTLVGAGGIGKSRLALETARAVLPECSDGVWLVELAALSDPSLVSSATAQAVGVRVEPGRTLVEVLCERLKSKRALLVFDNCEHLVDACAELIEKILRTCPEPRVLATSREPLAIAGEVVWPVPALIVPPDGMTPTASQLLQYEAAKLFLDRMALSKPKFGAGDRDAVTIAELCRRLEGIPLALELAAVRARALSLDQVLEKLEDRFRLLAGAGRAVLPRHQTLRATIEWSHNLLTHEEQVLLRRLSIFARGWTLSTAENVCGGNGISPRAVLDLLTHLVDRSLVIAVERGAETRYGMLETIRDYARECLRDSGEVDAVARRHAEVLLAFVEAAEPEVSGATGSQWLERLEAEHDNLRAALTWLLEHDADVGLRLAVALREFWEIHGHLTEGRRWLEVTRDHSHTAPVRVQTKALDGIARLAYRQGDSTAARSACEERLRTSREMGDRQEIAVATFWLGAVAADQGDLPAARAYVEESLVIAQEIRDKPLIATALNGLGEVARLEGAWADARKAYEQALGIWRQTANQYRLSIALRNLGATTWQDGDLSVASTSFREALAIDQKLGAKVGMALSLDGLAAVAGKRGASRRAARLAGAAQTLQHACGHRPGITDRAFRECYLAGLRVELGDVAFEAALAEGRALTLEQAVAEALEDIEA